MTSTTMPSDVVTRFTHAAVQALADADGIDLLHIKGPAVDDSLLQVRSLETAMSTGSLAGPVARTSADADVLVHPRHVDPLIEAMHRHGWTTAYRFEDGSAFEHAATLVHPFLAPVDLHRRFPGIDRDPTDAFDLLWGDRHDRDIAGRACAVPSVTAQRLILILHAARGAGADHPDISRCWGQATDQQRLAVKQLAGRLGAQVALAAGTGGLDDHVGAQGYELWRALSTGEGSVASMWWARVRAAPTKRSGLRTAVRLAVPNANRMRITLGRRPTVGEVLRAYGARAGMGAREVRRLLMAGWSRRGGPR